MLIIYPTRSSFVVNDIECLRNYCRVIEYPFGQKRGLDLFIRLIQLFFWILNNLRGTKAIYIWFADTHGLFPVLLGKVFRKKVVTFIGGYDAVKMPHLKYGAHLNPLRSYIIRVICNFSDVLIPSSRFTGEQLIETLGNKKLRQKMQVAFPGVDGNEFPLLGLEKRNSVICIAGGSSVNRMLLKGIDRFIEVAEKLPNYPFILVGPEEEAYSWVRKKAPANITIHPFTDRKELSKLLNRSAVLCLLSRNEAFGMVVIEGLLCGCTPIVMGNSGSAEILSRNNGPGVIVQEYNCIDIGEKVCGLVKTHTPEQAYINREYAISQFAGKDRYELISSYLKNNH